MRTLSPACAVIAAVSLLLAPAAAPAFAADGTYTVPLHQDLPLTATSDGVENEADCSTIPDDQDGWHFVLPGNSTDFVKLTVTFKPGGEQVVTDFGPPSDKHAYVASEPGAELVSAVAEVEGGNVEWFNLSHTCPASGSSESSAPATPSSPAPSTTQPGGAGGGTPTSSESASPSASSSESASAAPSASASATASAAADDSGLAETGANVGGIALAAVLLLGAGAATLVMLRRRRKA
ncbi:LPXTG cell wall anchor domain-containing protein [Streptomyces sp. NPDC059373]